MDESKSSKYISGGWSSAEIGGAVVLQCLSMIKMMTARASQLHNGVQFVKPSKPSILADAMTSSIVNSPSNIVRTSSLPVFKQLLFLHEREGKSNIKETLIVNDLNSSIHFHSPSLSVLVALLPVGRETSSTERMNRQEISSRCSVLFDLVISYISNTWSTLTTELRQKAVVILQKQLSNLTLTSLNDNSLSRPPDVKGIDELGILVNWAIIEFKCLRSKKDASFSAYVEGLLSLIQSIILLVGSPEVNGVIAGMRVSKEQSLLELLFESCTFHFRSSNAMTMSCFTTPSMRKKIMDLLNVMCKGSEQNLESLFSLILTHLYSNTPRKDLMKDWSIDPVMKRKSATGHVGMKNQGATCYLNSLLQQFFHAPSLRLGLLSCQLDSCPSDESSEGHRLLFELQRLFGNLSMSEKRDFDTADLVKSIRGYDGKPIRPGEQQDVDEFFNLFCDRLETALKKLPQNRLLHDVFGGQLSHLITCQKCHKSSERIEDFLSISLDVKGKYDIFESLQSYIHGEVLDGANKYFCSKCEAKRDSIKRCCIKTLPNVLICHLKRFDFDLEMLRKVKVNDRFEFPTELNMKKYTKEGLDESEHSDLSWRGENYYNYRLRGVLVHTGTADSGHYYSLSHVRNYDPMQPDQNHDEGSWFCFNDSIVSPFDPSTLEVSTFGGLNESSNIGPQLKRFDSTKSYSAYLLIYDRVDQYQFDEQINNEPKQLQMPTKQINIQSWAKGIVQENLSHAKDQIIFSPEYGSFITDVCKATFKNKEALSTLKAVQVLTFHLIENLIHARDRTSEIENIFSVLSSWYENSEESSRWFLELVSESHRHWIEKIFFHCYRQEIRTSFVNLLAVIFRKLAPSERETYYAFHPTIENDSNFQNDDGFDTDGDTMVYSIQPDNTTIPHATFKRVHYWKSKSILAIFIGRVLDLLSDCEVHWRRFDQIFECLTKFAACGHDEAIFLIR
jgi:ubiquitin C-terminal hydrolase